MSLIYLPLAIVAVASLLYYYFTRTFNYWKDRGVVGPEPEPFFGNIRQSALRLKNQGLVFKEIYDAFPNEKVVGVYRMTTPCLLVRDLDIIKHIMIKDFDIFVDRGIEFSKKGLGANLFHADGDTWRVLRNRFTPIFTSGKLKNMMYLITERGDEFINYVDSITSKQAEHDVYRLVQKFTLATISACAFGLEIDTHTNQDMIDTLTKMDENIFTPNFAQELDMMYPGILKKLNASFFPKFVSEFFYGLVRDVVNQRNGVPSNRKDFMDLILELRQMKEVYGSKKSEDDKQRSVELTDDVIAAQAFVFYAAGYETSATTMTFMLYELAKNRDIQEKLLADIDQVLEKYDGKVTYDALQEMTYLDRVFTETLRKHPILDPLIRCAKVDYKVPETNLTIAKGTVVLFTPLGVQNDEKNYSNPEKFDPDRHTPENSKDRHVCAYIPFGVGPRNCIGMRFAKVQSRVCLVKLLSKYRVAVSKNTPEYSSIISPYRFVVGPKSGIYLNLIRR